MTTQQILQGVHDWTNGKIVYDISVAHPDGQGNPTKYADLTAALGTGGANIPEALRKGGMSVKFVLSSDNKYIQARCMAQNFTTDVTQWQGVDDEPTAGSDNLVKGGAIFNSDSTIIHNSSLFNKLADKENKDDLLTGYFPTSGGGAMSSSSSRRTWVFVKKDGWKYIHAKIYGESDCYAILFWSGAIGSDTLISGVEGNNKIEDFFVEIPENAVNIGIVDRISNYGILDVIIDICTDSVLSQKIINENQNLLRQTYAIGDNDNYPFCAKQTINDNIESLFIEKRNEAVNHSLFLYRIDVTHNAVYFGYDNDRSSPITILLKNGFGETQHQLFGTIRIKLLQTAEDTQTASNAYNIGEKAYNPFFNGGILTALKEKWSIKSGVGFLDKIINGNSEHIYTSNSRLNDCIDFLYIENYSASVQHQLYISLVQPQYKAVFFGYDGTKNKFAVTWNETTNIGTRNDSIFGLIKVKVTPPSGNVTIGDSDVTNITDISYFPNNDIGLAKTNNENTFGKNILVIGDSIVAHGTWPEKVGVALNMNVTKHAKGGIGIITMVDGDNTLAALNIDDVTGKDIICICGFYNARTLAVSNPGNEDDMYPSQNTFIGQLNYAVNKIYSLLSSANNLKCKVIVVSAHKYGKYPYSELSAYDDGNELLSATKIAANHNSLLLVDLMNNAGINKYNWSLYQSSETPYNPSYIPADGVNDGTNKPFASIEDLPSDATDGDLATVGTVENYQSYTYNGSSWQSGASVPYVWLGDQLHLNGNGHSLVANYISNIIRLNVFGL